MSHKIKVIYWFRSQTKNTTYETLNSKRLCINGRIVARLKILRMRQVYRLQSIIAMSLICTVPVISKVIITGHTSPYGLTLAKRPGKH